MTSWRQTKN